MDDVPAEADRARRAAARTAQTRLANVVDPDRVDTWPPALRDAIAPYLCDLPAAQLGCELELPFTDADIIRLLDGRPVRAYHATRLLAHEAVAIRANGLRVLSEQGVLSRVADAVDAGELTPAHGEAVRDHTVYARRDRALKGRAGQICAVAGASAFAEQPDGFARLLSRWGGEAIYWHAPDGAATTYLRIGTPTLVAVDLPLAASPESLIWPGLSQLFGGHLASLPSSSAEVFFRADLPASCIAALWQPGDPEYDCYPELVRT
jgi:hypothetical protein